MTPDISEDKILIPSTFGPSSGGLCNAPTSDLTPTGIGSLGSFDLRKSMSKQDALREAMLQNWMEVVMLQLVERTNV